MRFSLKILFLPHEKSSSERTACTRTPKDSWLERLQESYRIDRGAHRRRETRFIGAMKVCNMFIHIYAHTLLKNTREKL